MTQEELTKAQAVGSTLGILLAAAIRAGVLVWFIHFTMSHDWLVSFVTGFSIASAGLGLKSLYEAVK